MVRQYYVPQVTELSEQELQAVFGAAQPPVCLLGGWAVQPILILHSADMTSMHSNRAPATNRIPELPTLDTGVTLLEPNGRTIGPLHTLVVDHVVLNRGPAYWIDTRGHARTQPLARLCSDRRLLDRIQVARAFTPFQHYSLVEHLSEHVVNDTSLLIVPAMDGLYRDDTLRDDDVTEMLVRTLAGLAGLVREHDLPIRPEARG